MVPQHQTLLTLDFEHDCFDNPMYEFDQFPDFKHYVINRLNDKGYELYTKRSSLDSGIPPGQFTIQSHQISVESHTDDVLAPKFFAIVPIQINPIVDQLYNSSSQFLFFKNRKKERTWIREFDVIIFNPRKPHQWIYYGEQVIYALFTVIKQRTTGETK